MREHARISEYRMFQALIAYGTGIAKPASSQQFDGKIKIAAF